MKSLISRSPLFTSLCKSLLTATSLAIATSTLSAADAVTLTTQVESTDGNLVSHQLRNSQEVPTSLGTSNQENWLLAGKKDKKDRDDDRGERRGRRDRDDDDEREGRGRRGGNNNSRAVVKSRGGWKSVTKLARLVNVQRNTSSLVVQLNVLEKPVTTYANVVYQVYARQNNQWVLAYNTTGARLITNNAGQISLPPEVIGLNQLRLGSNVDYSKLELKTVAQIRYDLQGRRDQRIEFEEIVSYGGISQISSLQQLGSFTTTSSTTTTTTTNQSSGGQAITLANGYRITFLGVTYGSNTSTWRYYMEELPQAQDLSNWVLGLPSCARVVSTSSKGEMVNPDPNARISGIKWQPGGGFQQGEFSVTLSGRLAKGTINVAAKGPDVARGVLPGPSCSGS